MNTIELQQTLPAVFAGRDSIISDVWHQSLTLKRGEAYLVEAASGTGKSSLCSYIYGYRNDYQGIICFDGKNIRTLSVRDWVEIRKCSISMLFQELRLFMSRILVEEADRQGAGIIVTSIGKHLELNYTKTLKL